MESAVELVPLSGPKLKQEIVGIVELKLKNQMTDRSDLETLVRLSCENGWNKKPLMKFSRISNSGTVDGYRLVLSLMGYDGPYQAIPLGSLNDIMFGGELGFLKGLCKAKYPPHYPKDMADDLAQDLVLFPESERVAYLVKEFLE